MPNLYADPRPTVYASLKREGDHVSIVWPDNVLDPDQHGISVEVGPDRTVYLPDQVNVLITGSVLKDIVAYANKSGQLRLELTGYQRRVTYLQAQLDTAAKTIRKIAKLASKGA